MKTKDSEKTLIRDAASVWKALDATYALMDPAVLTLQRTREEYAVSPLMEWLCV
jgi:hypothetical protein